MSKGILDLVNVYFRDFMIMVHGLHGEFETRKILLDETQPCKFPILRVNAWMSRSDTRQTCDIYSFM